jgi:outer membrane autotransporter protein
LVFATFAALAMALVTDVDIAMADGGAGGSSPPIINFFPAAAGGAGGVVGVNNGQGGNGNDGALAENNGGGGGGGGASGGGIGGSGGSSPSGGVGGGGPGQNGNSSTFSGGGGAGGGTGGANGLANAGATIISAPVAGGNGGNGGNGGDTSATALPTTGGGGGGGGAGGIGFLGTGSAAVTNASTITAGNGGSGGNGGNSTGENGSFGGNGGNGGDGGSGISMTAAAATVNNGGKIQAGNGGMGGSGGTNSGDSSGSGSSGGAGSNGGNGGIGVSFAMSGWSLMNSGTIRGGNGAAGGAGGAGQDGGTPGVNGAGGLGGAGVSGSGLAIINSGLIAGGVAADGTQANAITFTGGSNTLTMQPGGSLNGNIGVTGSVTFNQSTAVTLPNVITGAGSVIQNGGGTLTLTGTNAYTGGTFFTAGALAVSRDANLGAASGGLTFNGGTLEFLSGFITNRVILLNVGGGAVDTDGNNATLGGAISGAGSLTKQGAGLLDLTGTNTYSGATTVAAGTLVVEGSIRNSTATVQSGATLGGSGTVGSLVALAGSTIAPGAVTPFTTLNVAGNARFASGSTFLVDVNPTGQNDKLLVGGAATLSGGTVDIIAAAGSYTPATRFTLLTATGGVTGTFNQATTNFPFAFLTPSLSYDAHDVFLRFAQTAGFTSVAETRNQASTAAAIQPLGPGNPIFNAVLGQSVTGAQQAFNALSGEVHASAVTAAFEDSRLPREAILDRLSQPFTGPTLGSTMAAYAADMPTKAGPLAPPPEPRTISFWGQAFGDFGRNGSDGNAASLSRSTDGFILGGDANAIGVAGGDWRFGAAAGYTYDSFNVSDRDSSGHFQSVFGAVYGGASFGALQLRSGAIYGVNSTATDRQIIFPGFAEAVTSSYGGSIVQGFGEAGYRLALAGYPGLGIGRGTLEPFVGAAAIHIHQDAFNEPGGLAALSGFGQDFDLGTTTVGLRAESTFVGSWPLTARALLGWRHAYGDVAPAALLAFQGSPQPFSIAGVPIDRDAFVTELGLDYDATSHMTLGVAYTGQYGEHATDSAIKGLFKYRF